MTKRVKISGKTKPRKSKTTIKGKSYVKWGTKRNPKNRGVKKRRLIIRKIKTIKPHRQRRY